MLLKQLGVSLLCAVSLMGLNVDSAEARSHSRSQAQNTYNDNSPQNVRANVVVETVNRENGRRSNQSETSVAVQVEVVAPKQAVEPRTTSHNNDRRARSPETRQPVTQRRTVRNSRNTGDIRNARNVRNSRSEPVIRQVDPVSFQEIRSELSKLAFADSKSAMLKSIAQYNYFTVDQVKILVNDMTFSSLKVEAATLLYPKVVDPERYFVVLNAMTFESDRREVRESLGMI